MVLEGKTVVVSVGWGEPVIVFVTEGDCVAVPSVMDGMAVSVTISVSVTLALGVGVEVTV